MDQEITNDALTLEVAKKITFRGLIILTLDLMLIWTGINWTAMSLLDNIMLTTNENKEIKQVCVKGTLL